MLGAKSICYRLRGPSPGRAARIRRVRHRRHGGLEATRGRQGGYLDNELFGFDVAMDEARVKFGRTMALHAVGTGHWRRAGD